MFVSHFNWIYFSSSFHTLIRTTQTVSTTLSLVCFRYHSVDASQPTAFERMYSHLPSLLWVSVHIVFLCTWTVSLVFINPISKDHISFICSCCVGYMVHCRWNKIEYFHFVPLKLLKVTSYDQSTTALFYSLSPSCWFSRLAAKSSDRVHILAEREDIQNSTTMYSELNPSNMLSTVSTFETDFDSSWLYLELEGDSSLLEST